RVFATGLPGLSGEWAALLAFVAAASMIVGNLAAIAQSSVKRLLAYSGIAQAGYVLVGVIAGGADGQASVLFYLAAYLVMNFGAVIHIWTRVEAAERRLRLPAAAGLAIVAAGVLSVALGIVPAALFGLAQAGAVPVAGLGGG